MMPINTETATTTVNVASVPPISTAKPAEKTEEATIAPAYTVEISPEGAQLSAAADLSQYSEAQLKKMLNDGEISPSAYNAELAKRQQAEQSIAAMEAAGASTLIDAIGK